jgi:hypothetical protein
VSEYAALEHAPTCPSGSNRRYAEPKTADLSSVYPRKEFFYVRISL